MFIHLYSILSRWLVIVALINKVPSVFCISVEVLNTLSAFISCLTRERNSSQIGHRFVMVIRQSTVFLMISPHSLTICFMCFLPVSLCRSKRLFTQEEKGYHLISVCPCLSSTDFLKQSFDVTVR